MALLRAQQQQRRSAAGRMLPIVFTVVGLFSLLFSLPLAGALPSSRHIRQVTSSLAPVIDVDFPDPTIVQDYDGTWYSFATEGNGYNIQIATAPEPWGPWTVLALDALPDPGPWTSGQNSWAPDVRSVAPGKYVLFYAGELANDTAHHCVGTATASTITGPFTPADEPLYCHLSMGGSIDPSGYYDVASRTHWLVYKIDGNSIGYGGDCNNGVAPIQPTPIMLQQMSDDDWTTPIGDPIEILDRTDADGPLVEAPDIIRAEDGRYILFYSSNCYTSPLYAVRYATAPALTGPYTRAADNGSLIMTGEYGLTAPGGATATTEFSSTIVFHANCDAGRCMFTSNFTIGGTVITLEV